MVREAAEQPRRHPLIGALIAALSWLIRLYQRVLSPAMRPRCRFVPSCSEYAVQSLHRHGLIKGSTRALWRVCRCHPFGKPGYDPP